MIPPLGDVVIAHAARNRELRGRAWFAGRG